MNTYSTTNRIASIAAAVFATAFGVISPSAHSAPAHLLRPGTNLSAVHVTAGSTYQLQAGSTYTGTLNVNANAVTVESVGRGQWATITRHSYGSDIEVSGSGDVIRWLRITGQGYRGKNGYILGVAVSGDRDTVTDVHLYGDLYAGVYFESTATNGIVSRSFIDHCDALNPARPGSGAFGVLLWGSHNLVEGNKIINQNTASPVYGRDGSAVEVYHGRDNTVRGNRGANDLAFTELGGKGAADNAYIGNTFTGPGDFLITRGSGDRLNGPVFDTTMTGNYSKGEVVSYDWRRGDGTLLTLTHNTIYVPGGTALWTDGGYRNGGKNKFTGRVVIYHRSG